MQLSYLSDGPLGSMGSLEEAEPEAWVEILNIREKTNGWGGRS